MAIDLEKLPAAPWETTGMTLENDAGVAHDHVFVVSGGDDEEWICEVMGQDDNRVAIAEFIRLSRVAFDIMLRRGWGVTGDADGEWFVHARGQLPGRFFNLDHCGRFADPFTAIVEADKWFRENVASDN